MAIWYVDNMDNADYKELASNTVHERFHSYQISQKETRFPDDIKGLSHPE